MKIYRVVCYDNAHSFYHFGTRKEAAKAMRELRAEYKQGEYPDASIELEVIEFAATKTGFAAELQALVEYTCINEH